MANDSFHKPIMDEPPINLVLLQICKGDNKETLNLIRKIQQHMSQIDDRVQAISLRVDEAMTEITELLQKLHDENLTETGLAALANVEARVNSLADIVPNPTP